MTNGQAPIIVQRGFFSGSSPKQLDFKTTFRKFLFFMSLVVLLLILLRRGARPKSSATGNSSHETKTIKKIEQLPDGNIYHPFDSWTCFILHFLLYHFSLAVSLMAISRQFQI